jgi:hypothetical protein
MAKGVSAAQAANSVTKLSPVARMKQQMDIEAELDAQNGSSNFMEQAIEEMLIAESFEETMVLAASDAGLANGKNLVNKGIRVTDIQIVKSDDKYKDSSPIGFYVRITGTFRNTGKDFQAATGAPKVVVPLWRARGENRFPLDCVIREREVGSGTMLFLELDGPSVVESSVEEQSEDAPGY